MNLAGIAWDRGLIRDLDDPIGDYLDTDHFESPHNRKITWRILLQQTSDGQQVQSVSGGGHWGGGMFISSRDHARFGYLFLRRGMWGTQAIVSEHWIDEATTPVEVQPNYGFMWSTPSS